MKVADSHMLGMISDLLMAPPECLNPVEVFDWAEKNSEVLNTPFPLTDVRIVYDRLAVVSDAMRPTNGKSIIPVLRETEEPVILAPDIHRSGREALFFFCECDHNTAIDWIKNANARNRTEIVLGSRQNRMVIAASFTAFLRDD